MIATLYYITTVITHPKHVAQAVLALKVEVHVIAQQDRTPRSKVKCPATQMHLTVPGVRRPLSCYYIP